MSVFAAATINFLEFSWHDWYDLLSLSCFVLLIVLFFVIICCKKWDTDSKTHQLLLGFSSEIDYKKPKKGLKQQDKQNDTVVETR